MRASLRKIRFMGALSIGITLAACGEEAQISAAYRSDAIVPRAYTSVTTTDGRRRHVFQGAALLPVGGKDSPRPTATSGEATVDIVMRDARGAIATGRVTLVLKPDWIWGVELHIDSANPARYCFGCVGSQAFRLRDGVGRTVRDSLWVTWGGNSIRNPVVY